jgi:hypothetical protein
MPGKMARSDPRPPCGLPRVTVAVNTSGLSCRKAGTARIFTPSRESSGVSRFRSLQNPQCKIMQFRAKKCFRMLRNVSFCFVHTCASMDGVRMARTFFDVLATFGRGAVIDPASWCGSYDPRALMVIR